MAEHIKPQKMSAQSYRKDDRLLKRPDFVSLSKEGRKCLKKHFLCFFRKGCTEKSRLGITVTKKNWLRRREKSHQKTVPGILPRSKGGVVRHLGHQPHREKKRSGGISRAGLEIAQPNFSRYCGERAIRKLALIIIRVYQAAISPYLGRNCRFYPTCSQYSYQAISKYGVLTGCYLSFKRIAKCHPFHSGGYDPLP